MLRRDLLKVGLGVLGVLFPLRKTYSQTTLELTGQVLDRKNEPVPSVLVTAYRVGGEKIKPSTTGRDGGYKIEYTGDSAIETVRYERTGYLPGVVEDLSGTRGHIINKVMYAEGTKLSILEAQASLSAIERIYYMERIRETRLGVLQKMYGATVKNLIIPRQLEDRRYSVLKLYALG